MIRNVLEKHFSFSRSSDIVRCSWQCSYAQHDGKMVEVQLDFYRIQKSRLNELSSRTQPAARKLRYSVSVLTVPGFHPWSHQARPQERTGCQQSEGSDRAAICKWPGVLQSQSKTANPGLSILVPCEAGRYSHQSQQDRLPGSVYFTALIRLAISAE